MSGIHTGAKYAILDVSSGLNLDAYADMRALTEAALYRWRRTPDRAAGGRAGARRGVRRHPGAVRRTGGRRAQNGQPLYCGGSPFCCP